MLPKVVIGMLVDAVVVHTPPLGMVTRGTLFSTDREIQCVSDEFSIGLEFNALGSGSFSRDAEHRDSFSD